LEPAITAENTAVIAGSNRGHFYINWIDAFGFLPIIPSLKILRDPLWMIDKFMAFDSKFIQNSFLSGFCLLFL